MGTRCITAVMDGNREILCMYRQFDGYPTGHGTELLKAFKGYRVTNGVSIANSKRSANGMGCFAAQLVSVFKRADKDSSYPAGNGCEVGGFYLYAPETREVGEEFVYVLEERASNGKSRYDFGYEGRLWLTVYEGEVAFFGLPGTKPELMDWLYSGWLDDFDPKREASGQVYHSAGK